MILVINEQLSSKSQNGPALLKPTLFPISNESRSMAEHFHGEAQLMPAADAVQPAAMVEGKDFYFNSHNSVRGANTFSYSSHLFHKILLN